MKGKGIRGKEDLTLNHRGDSAIPTVRDSDWVNNILAGTTAFSFGYLYVLYLSSDDNVKGITCAGILVWIHC